MREPLTNREIERIRRLKRRGWTWAKISITTGHSLSTVSKYLYVETANQRRPRKP